MRQSSQVLLEKYQIRKSKAEKRHFIDWLTNHLKQFDLEINEDKYAKNGINLIVGDIETAELIVTAHYDTQPNFFMPVFMGFSNWFSFFISQLYAMIPLIIIMIGVFIFGITPTKDGVEINVFFSLPIVVLMILYCLQITFGIANKHTANDNTSGVATVLAIMEDLPVAQRDKVCFVFFDQEELGLVGAGEFKKKYRQFMSEKPLINFDCVSDGETLFFVTKKQFKESDLNPKLMEAVGEIVAPSEKQFAFGTALKHIYTSDQIIFKNSVGVVAAKKLPVFGYYIDRIHSRWDTKFDGENIELLSRAMLEFIGKI